MCAHMRSRDLVDREKILKYISKRQGMNITRLGRETGFNWSKLNRLLGELIEEGIIKESRYEFSTGRRIRMFSLKEGEGMDE